MKKQNLIAITLVAVMVLAVIIGIALQENRKEIPLIDAPLFEQTVDVNVAKIMLTAPETCSIGELVVLDASASVGTSFSWEVEPTTTNFAVIEDGKRAFFTAAKPGCYTFFCAVAKDNTVDTTIHKIRVIGPKVTVVQDDFTILVRSWLPDNCDPMLLQGLSRSFTEAANSETIEEMIKITASTNRAVLGLSLNDYRSFLQSFSTYLRENYQDKSLEEHQELWLNVAKALSC
jgi:hypothetical protein